VDHHIGSGSFHKLVIARSHRTQRKGKTFEDIELCHQADDLQLVDNRIGIEIIAGEQIVEFVASHDTVLTLRVM
jgi:hypothetical protein